MTVIPLRETVARSLFWCASASLLALAPLARAQQKADAEPIADPRLSTVRIVQRVADKETVSLAVKVEQTDALITVLHGVDEGTSFTCRTDTGEHPASLVYHDAKSHLALVYADTVKPKGIRHGGSQSVGLDGTLRAITVDEALAVRFAGRVKQLEGEPLLLTLLRVHTGAAELLPGSPLVDEQDRIVALALSPLDGQGAWLAVPIEAALKVAADVKRFGKSQSGQLEVGIAVGSTTPRLEFVKPGSRAERAGLKAGDVICRIGDRPITEALDILDANFYLTTHEAAPIRILRGLESLTLAAPALETK